ncbi:permease-like cell division protein FtsX [Olsenella sp. YH-ols2217]|uniref:Cell division protein FtsX n=1 Tax=Kribbibacterium absianum TaxID=3044210 RepID=A0ABT6ZK04_9ACTN|nr:MULTISPECIES: permease-like cell division protein FtsX [unclassified Olsenella]MDJ1122357.1 permease-like cell division protein FtsX [Olsenella sp. YH-ols2216]MDJ1129389.1 permease-like cell division protein FtsX [Olsenella sp. YH-ols2217]
MAPSNFGYSLREAGHHFRRNWSTALGAVVTIFLSLFIIGLFMLGSSVLTNMVGSVEDKVTIQAFLSDDANQENVDALQKAIQGWGDVESVTYKSKDEALDEYRNTMSNKNAAAAVDALDGQNPVPASLVIKLTDPQQVSTVADKLIADADFKAVCDDPDNPAASVQYGQETVERLFSVTNYVRIIAIVLVILLTFVAFVFINNTIRLAISARRREIAIMRLVGASNGFIRGPFVMEGALEALIGALLAIGALQLGISFLLPKIEESLQFLAVSLDPTVVAATYGLLLVVGVLIGLLGSAIAMRRYLKV